MTCSNIRMKKTKNKNKKNVIPVLKIINDDVRTISADRTSFLNEMKTNEILFIYYFDHSQVN